MTARLATAGHDAQRVAQNVARWADGLRTAVRSAADQGTRAVAAALDGAGFGEMFGDSGPLALLYAAKRAAARDLIAACRQALDGVAGPRRRLEPQAFPPPFHRISGFPLTGLDGIADAVGIKLYTMHWPMIARYWARDLLGDASAGAQDAATAAIAHAFGFTDALVLDGDVLRYPEPHVPHPVGTAAQARKLAQARAMAGAVATIAFAHAYGPVADVVRRSEIAAASGLPVWINRYGYLSDAKLSALAHVASLTLPRNGASSMPD
jgi:hypothetical protein